MKDRVRKSSTPNTYLTRGMYDLNGEIILGDSNKGSSHKLNFNCNENDDIITPLLSSNTCTGRLQLSDITNVQRPGYQPTLNSVNKDFCSASTSTNLFPENISSSTRRTSSKKYKSRRLNFGKSIVRQLDEEFYQENHLKDNHEPNSSYTNRFKTDNTDSLFQSTTTYASPSQNQANNKGLIPKKYKSRRLYKDNSVPNELNEEWGQDVHFDPFSNIDIFGISSHETVIDTHEQNSPLPNSVLSVSSYLDIGDCNYECIHCGAHFWYAERVVGTSNLREVKYSSCCQHGKIKIAKVRDPPVELQNLIYGLDRESKHFQSNIRSYNCMFSFTSLGGKIKKNDNTSRGPPIFQIGGQNFHRIGSLIPVLGDVPRFAQLYMYDTDNEDFNRVNAVRRDSVNHTLHMDIVAKLRQMLDEHNALVKSFRMAREKISAGNEPRVQLRLIGNRSSDARTYNLPTVGEVAALVVGDFDSALGDRDILVETQSGLLKRISELNPAYLGLQYPLLFPYGDDGYREDIPFRNVVDYKVGGRRSVSIREFLAYRFHERINENRFILHSRRLFQEICVDGYTMMESFRLHFIRKSQKKLRCDMYNRFTDSLLSGDNDSSTKGQRVILPPTFVGGARYMIQNYQDAMAICRWTGYPDLFLTFTCNPKWPEIQRFLSARYLNPEDRPDILSRVFQIKLTTLIQDIKKKKFFGAIRAVIYTVEYQKRGLPHAHILFFLGSQDKIPSPKEIDQIISAELPDKDIDPEYFKAVTDYMLHGPCGKEASHSPCMKEGKCTKYFPKKFNDETTIDEDGYPKYRRRNDGRTTLKNGVLLDNRFVVPHNKFLLLKYGAHLNVEWCNQSRSIKYLFKYVNKGHDRVTAGFYESTRTSSDPNGKQPDEIQMYYDCRYISPCEATWRIFKFPIQYRLPNVERLGFHLPDEQWIFFADEDNAKEVERRESIRESKFLAWMKANAEYTSARNLTYAEFPQQFVWKDKNREWVPRQRGFGIGRITYVPPGSGECYYLRILLNIVKGPTSYEDIRTVNGVVHSTYRGACYALGLLDDDKEYIDGFKEASQWATATQLRVLFVTLLTNNSMSRPIDVWEQCREYLSDDILQRRRRLLRHEGLQLTSEEIFNYALVEIEGLLRARGSSLRDYDDIPFPNMDSIGEINNRLIHDELQYDRIALANEHDSLSRVMNEEQRATCNRILKSVEDNSGGLFFVYGYGGTGKTFVWKALSAFLRSKGDIVLNVASSGIASLLLPGGRTAHSRFAIPITPHENSTCNIQQGSHLAQLIIRAKLIIWDEAPMTHKFCFEALDRSMRDIMRTIHPEYDELPFGGKTVVLGGDFRQILPVIPKGTRQDIVNATINSSYLWDYCTVLRLTKNMRLASMVDSSNYQSLSEFATWIANVGDGNIGNADDGINEIQIPSSMILKHTGDPIAAIVQATYPDFNNIISNPKYLQERAILAPTLDVVDAVNDYMTSLNVLEESKIYLSADTICKSDSNVDVLSDLHSPEFLNSIKASGIPNHQINLKVGSPIMLLRNIDPSMGLCNGTRLIVSRLGNHLIQAKLIAGKFAGQEVVIPRLSLIPSDTRIPFKFQRKQFPIMTSYAMTINKSQGQSLSHVGLLLQRPVFSHGQLYVALSRVTNKDGLKILICNDDNPNTEETTNVVYKEVFRNV